MRWRVSNKWKNLSNWRIFIRNSERIWSLISKEDFSRNHMIDLDEFAICTHEEADMMIFVHTDYATKEGGPEWVLIGKASDTDIIFIAVSQYDVSFPRDWSTPAVNCMWTSQHWRWIPVHKFLSPLGHRRAGAFTPSPITGFVAVSTFCDKGNKMWDNWCLAHIKPVPIYSIWWWHGDFM